MHKSASLLPNIQYVLLLTHFRITVENVNELKSLNILKVVYPEELNMFTEVKQTPLVLFTSMENFELCLSVFLAPVNTKQ